MLSYMSSILLEWKEIGEGREEVRTMVGEWGVLGVKYMEAPMLGVTARPQGLGAVLGQAFVAKSSQGGDHWWSLGSSPQSLMTRHYQ